MQRLIQTAILTLALGAASAAFAQAPTPPPDPQSTQQGPPPMRQPDPAKEARRMSKQLGLSPDQTTQIQAVFADREQRVQALMASNPDPKTMRKQRRGIMQDEQSKLNTILTPAQQQQLATLRSERKGGGGTQTAPPPASPDFGLENSNL